MIPPKEKANELISKFLDYADDEYHDCATQHELNKAKKRNAKECAKLAVEEILKSKPCKWDGYEYQSNFKYWNEVIEEIDKVKT